MRGVSFTTLVALLSGGCHLLLGHSPGDGASTERRPDQRADQPAPDQPRPPDMASRPEALLPKPDLPAKPELPKSDLPPPPLFLDELNGTSLGPSWKVWRMQYEVSGGKLRFLPAAEVGFNYGHGGNGRGGMALVEIGKTSWKNYRLQLTAESLSVGSYNPHSLDPCFRAIIVYFRLQTANKSWNAPALTSYQLSLNTATCPAWFTKGDWTLARMQGYYIPGLGYSTVYSGAAIELAKGNTPLAIDGANEFDIRVIGSQIKILLNGGLLVDLVDQPTTVGDASAPLQPLLFGGVGVHFGFENLGLIDRVQVDPLP